MDLPANIKLQKDHIETFYELAERIKSHESCVFVGAGLSKMTGYPLWEDLLQVLKCEAEIKTGKSIIDDKVDKQIRGQRYKKILGVRRYRELINHEFDPNNDRQPFLPSHISLVELPFIAYVTTNYDCNIEHAFESKGLEANYSAYPLLLLSKVRERLIYHIHGIIDHNRLSKTQGSIVLVKKDFEEAYKSNSKVVDLLKCLYSETSILFVGYNVTDDFFMRILKHSQEDFEEIKKVAYERGGEKCRDIYHYALLEFLHDFYLDEDGNKVYLPAIDYEGTIVEDQELKSMGIKTIRYIGDKNNHTQLIYILQELSRIVNGIKRITAKPDRTYTGVF